MEYVDYILIVDDDCEICELVGNYLKKNGLCIIIVVDGWQMCVFFEVNMVDLIVFDIMMFGDDGLLFCCELCVGKYKVMLVLMFIVCNDEIDCIIGLEMGVDDYLIKFFFVCELFVWINVVLWCMWMLLLNFIVSESSWLIGFGQW